MMKGVRLRLDWQKVVIVIAGLLAVVASLHLIPPEDTQSRGALLAGLFATIGLLIANNRKTCPKCGAKLNDRAEAQNQEEIS